MMLQWPWAKLEWRAVCAERCTYGSGRRSAIALLTPLPMAKGFVYLCAVVDWFSRRVLSWRLSITLETAFCIEAFHDALSRYPKPEIINTDQGSQFTSTDFTQMLKDAKIKISMDGKGHGGTMSLSNGSGVQSNTRRFICMPTNLCQRLTKASENILHSTTPAAHIHRLTG